MLSRTAYNTSWHDTRIIYIFIGFLSAAYSMDRPICIIRIGRSFSKKNMDTVLIRVLNTYRRMPYTYVSSILRKLYNNEHLKMRSLLQNLSFYKQALKTSSRNGPSWGDVLTRVLLTWKNLVGLCPCVMNVFFCVLNINIYCLFVRVFYCPPKMENLVRSEMASRWNSIPLYGFWLLELNSSLGFGTENLPYFTSPRDGLVQQHGSYLSLLLRQVCYKILD